MKKIAYLGALALGLTLVACDNYKEPNPPAQSNGPVSVLSPDDVTVTETIDPTTIYNLQDYDVADQNILIGMVSVDDLDMGFTMGAEVSLSYNGGEPVNIPAIVEESTRGTQTYDIFIAPDDVQGFIYNNVSKAPKQKTITVSYIVTTVDGNQVAYVGDPATNMHTLSMEVMPFPSEFVIEDAYYLIGTIDDWSLAEAIKFNHSDEDPYDDPVFSVLIEIPADQKGNWWWKVIPQSTYEAGTWDAANTDYGSFGVAQNGDTAASGMLIPYKDKQGDDLGSGNFGGEGPYFLTINMEEGTYEFTMAVEELYVAGNAQGWDPGTALVLTQSDYINYSGYVNLDGEFKLCTARDWDHPQYGAGDGEGKIALGGGNLSVETPGLYWLAVNLQELTINPTLMETYGLIGSATSGGWDTSTPLTPSADFLTWTAKVTLTDGDIKFRANNGWDFNLGGTLENLTPNGDNIPVSAGTYMVTLDFSQLPYSAKLVAQ